MITDDEPRFLSEKEVLLIHQNQIDLYGGSSGIRDAGMLESALEAPRFDFYYKQADAIELVAAYFSHLIQNHAFIDGNKRVGTASALVFLDLAGIWLEIPDDELERLALDIAQGSLTKEQVAAALRSFHPQ
jgi:death-on-curing protein